MRGNGGPIADLTKANLLELARNESSETISALAKLVGPLQPDGQVPEAGEQ
jgi:hypothetical protein